MYFWKCMCFTNHFWYFFSFLSNTSKFRLVWWWKPLCIYWSKSVLDSIVIQQSWWATGLWPLIKRKKKEQTKKKNSASIIYRRPYIDNISLSCKASVSKLSKLTELGILQPQFPNCAKKQRYHCMLYISVRLCVLQDAGEQKQRKQNPKYQNVSCFSSFPLTPGPRPRSTVVCSL